MHQVYPNAKYRFSFAHLLRRFGNLQTICCAVIVGVLQEAEKGETTITALCKERGITETTFYRWRNKFGGMQVKGAHRLRELEKENARLKRLLAERDLEVDVVKEALTKNW